MIQKKTTKGDLEKRKSTFLTLGLVLVLGLVYVAFELYATQDKESDIMIIEDDFVEVMDEDVIATDQTPPPPPPPVQQQQEVILNVVEDNITVQTDWDFSQDFDENFEVEEYRPIDIVEEVVEETPPVRFAEEMPEFSGGQEAMYAWLHNELQYPEVARTNGIQGVVLVEFVVERDGSISNVKALAPLYPDCDQEAIRVIRKMPKWKPGKSMGKPVRCFFQIPVRFILG